jgi:transcription elongation factor GreA
MENEKVFLTKEGLEKLQEDLRKLKETDRVEVVQELKDARAQGDLSENADYDAARTRQAQIESKIKEIEHMIANAEIIDDRGLNSRIVRLGSTVRIRDLSDDEEYEYTIVGTVETNPLKGKISNESEMAKAVLNRKKGDVVTVRAIQPYDVEILEIKK